MSDLFEVRIERRPVGELPVNQVPVLVVGGIERPLTWRELADLAEACIVALGHREFSIPTRAVRVTVKFADGTRKEVWRE